MWRRQEGTKSIERPRALPPGAEKLWRRFVFSSRRSRWFKPDWNVFYEFVRHCHDRRVKLSPADVMYLAEDEGVVHEGAEELATIYLHCRSVLATRYVETLNHYDFAG